MIVSPATVADPPANITGITPSVLTGGLRGERRVRFRFTTDSSNEAPATARLLITLGRIGVDPTTPGSITITSGFTFAGESIVETTRLANVVKTANALSVEVTPQMQTASVEDGFMKFKPGTGVDTDQLAANVGKLKIGIATATPTRRDAGRGDAVSGGVVTLVSHIASDATISFLGDTSFVASGDDGKKKVYVSTDATCPSATSIQDDDDATKLQASLSDFSNSGPGAGGQPDPNADGAYLCMMVDGDTAIPVNEPYTANITYTSVLATNAAFPPEASTETLGKIVRDGSSVHIAYLTTNQKYNQRLVVVNRSSGPVNYSMTFQTQEGVTAEVGDGASGMFPVGRTVMDVRDIVTFDNGGNGSHGSAVIAAVVARGSLDVATVTTTKADGSTDTVVWDTMSQ